MRELTRCQEGPLLASTSLFAPFLTKRQEVAVGSRHERIKLTDRQVRVT
jgi:hypothetical protein